MDIQIAQKRVTAGETDRSWKLDSDKLNESHLGPVCSDIGTTLKIALCDIEATEFCPTLSALLKEENFQNHVEIVIGSLKAIEQLSRRLAKNQLDTPRDLGMDQVASLVEELHACLALLFSENLSSGQQSLPEFSEGEKRFNRRLFCTILPYARLGAVT